jgi:hypothetical protein
MPAVLTGLKAAEHSPVLRRPPRQLDRPVGGALEDQAITVPVYEHRLDQLVDERTSRTRDTFHRIALVMA